MNLSLSPDENNNDALLARQRCSHWQARRNFSELHSWHGFVPQVTALVITNRCYLYLADCSLNPKQRHGCEARETGQPMLSPLSDGVYSWQRRREDTQLTAADKEKREAPSERQC